MKTSLLFSLCCVAVLPVAWAENSNPVTVPSSQGRGVLATRDMDGNVKSPDGLAVIKGALMYIKGGKITRVNNELKLSEGITARPNRQVTLANGQTMDLQEGQMVTLDGKLMNAPAGLGSTAPGSASIPTAPPVNPEYGNSGPAKK
jgi:hypothetical protein